MIAVEPLADREAIDRILRAPEIAPKITHDGREPGYITHPLVSYWGAWVDDELVGVFLTVRFSRWEVETHAAILRAGRHHARDLARMYLACIFDDPEIERVTAYVMATLPSAANFCRKVGFEYEGRRRNACRVDGQLTDVLIYGLVRR